MLDRALRVADELAQGSQQAIRWTKRSLVTGWLTSTSLPQHELSAALEVIGFAGADYFGPGRFAKAVPPVSVRTRRRALVLGPQPANVAG